jgi:hypothetical protein
LAAGLGGVVAIRVSQLHAGLLYPDGYQYLLMARGISAHGRPLLRLGAGGDLFVPNLDASLKPLFPTLVAAAHLLGPDWLTAARAVTAVAGASTVALCAALARRLTRSWTSGAVAGSICLASPSLAYWGGFVGPDALAPALALAAALALLDRRPALGGALVAACIATRPEYAALALAAVPAPMLDRRARPALIRAATTATFVLALLLASVRPPLGVPDARLLIGGGVATALLGALLVVTHRDTVPPAVWACAAAVGAATLAVVGVPGGFHHLLASDWPLLIAAGAGFASALRYAPLRPTAVSLALATTVLAAVYFAKNPDLERYLSQLVVPLALIAALGATRLRTAVLFAPALAALVLLPSTRPDPGTDAFAAAAPVLRQTRGTIVTAAPDAYGLLLYPRPVRALRPGEYGLVVLDAAQRTFEPELGVRGLVIREVSAGDGLRRPDGRVDRKPTLLLRGSVVSRRN